MAGGYLTARPLRELRPRGSFAALTSRVGLPHSSNLTPHSYDLTPHSSLLIPTTSLLTPHPHSTPVIPGLTRNLSAPSNAPRRCTACRARALPERNSGTGEQWVAHRARHAVHLHLTPSLLRPHSSLLTPHSSLLTPTTSLLTPHSSLLNPRSEPGRGRELSAGAGKFGI